MESLRVPIADSSVTSVTLNITFDIDANGILKVTVVDYVSSPTVTYYALILCF